MQFPELSDEELSKRKVHFTGPVQTAMAAELSRRQAVKAQQMLSGEDMYRALTSIIPEMVTKAPADHDVLIEAFGMMVLKIRFIEPHSFVFEGYISEDTPCCAVAHFSQVVTKVIFRPKKGPTRVITGFARA